MRTTNRLGAWGILFTMGISWGLSFSLARIAAVGGVHPLSLTFWESAIAGGILLGMALLRRRPIPVSRELLMLYIVASILGLVIPAAIYFYAASHVPAGILSISLAAIPILTFVASALLRLEAFARSRALGVVLGMAAIVILVGPEQSLPDPAQIPWVLLSLVSAACYATMNIVLTMWTPARSSSSTTTCGMFVSSALILVPVLYVTQTPASLGWPWTEIQWAILGLGLINAVSYTLYFYLIENAGPVFTSQTANLVTLFGVIWGIIIFGEQNSIWVWLSLGTMMVALALVMPREDRGFAREPAQ